MLAVLIGAFLMMIAIQLIRIERTLSSLNDIADIKVKKLYGK
jgi:hypothetical protein